MIPPAACTDGDTAGQHILIDFDACSDKAAALARIAAAMQFPAWFGHNWDALSDCLADLSWLPASSYTIELAHTQALRTAAPAVFATLMEILAEAAAFWADQGIAFVVRVSAHDARS